MTKAEFLKALEETLSALSAEDRAASLAYYEEIINDRMEEGLCEADAVAAAGPVEEAAAQLLAETPHQETRLRVQPRRIRPADGFLLFTDPFDAVEISALCADVELWPSEGGVCRVEFQDKHHCTAAVEDGVLCITELRRHSSPKLEFLMSDNALRVYLPAASYRLLDAETRSGDLDVADGLTFARATLRSASGDIEFRADALNELSIRTASGDVEVKRAAPERMQLETASGDVGLSGCGTSSVTVRTSSGDVEFTDCDEAALDIHTVSGDIDGRFSMPRAVSASSVSGDIDVPRSGSGAPCVLHTVSGDIDVCVK